LEELRISRRLHCHFCNILNFGVSFRVFDKWSVGLRRRTLTEIKEHAAFPAMHIVQRLVLLPHLGKAHWNAFQRNSGALSLVHIYMHDPNLALVFFFPACKSVGSFATSRASTHRVAKKTKSSKKRRRGRLLVAYRSTTIDLKCLARKFVGKLITFRRLRFNCTSCEWAREMHRRRSNRTQATALATGSPQAFCLWKSDTCLYRINAFLRMRGKCKLSLTLANFTECKWTFHHVRLARATLF